MPLTGSDFILIIWREEIERNTTFIVTNRPPDTALFKRGAIPVSPKVPSVRVSERGPSERRQTWGPHPQGPQGLLCWPRHGRKHNNIFIFVNVLSALWPYSLQVHPQQSIKVISWLLSPLSAHIYTHIRTYSIYAHISESTLRLPLLVRLMLLLCC